jgi:hypothetical protein
MRISDREGQQETVAISYTGLCVDRRAGVSDNIRIKIVVNSSRFGIIGKCSLTRLSGGNLP